MSSTWKYGRNPGAEPPVCIPPGGVVLVMWNPPGMFPSANSQPNTPWKNARPPAASGAIELEWSVARDPDLRDVVAGGAVAAGPDADFTAKVDVGGLEPDTHYWYAFARGGERSPVGRTRTLPAATDHLRFAAVS